MSDTTAPVAALATDAAVAPEAAAPVPAAAAPAPAPEVVGPPVVNFAMSNKSVMVNGREEKRVVVSYGNPLHTLECKVPDMGDQFDLAEIAGEQMESGNFLWTNMAVVGASVRMIDGKPVPGNGSLTKARIKDVLVQIGRDGVRCVTFALSANRDGDVQPAEQSVVQHRTAVGN